MAEYVLAYILRAERLLPTAAVLQREREWDQAVFKAGTRPVNGLTLGILGCGDIGATIARTAKAFGM